MKVPPVMQRSAMLLDCAASYSNSDNAFSTAGSLAFFCAFSVAPLLVIILTMVGFVFGADTASAQISAQLNALFGPSTGKILLGAIKSSQRASAGLATTISVVTLLIEATTVLAALEEAFFIVGIYLGAWILVTCLPDDHDRSCRFAQ